jgi:hypothetical protein
MNQKYFTSPQRFEFMRSIRKKSFEDKQITEEQLKQWNEYIDECKRKDATPYMTEGTSLEYDLRYSENIANKCKASDVYSQNLYAAMCNNQFVHADGAVWSCSWRSAGGIVANLREEGDYINWYCSGIGADELYMPEGSVTEEVKKDIEDLGWTIEEAS